MRNGCNRGLGRFNSCLLSIPNLLLADNTSETELMSPKTTA